MLGLLLPVFSLLLSVALLLVGHGMQLTLLPLRGVALHFSEAQIGFTASSYFLGFMAGCWVAPRVIRRVGHIRSFAVMAAVTTVVILLLHLASDWRAWLVLRFATGIVISGLYTVIESWLNDQTGNDRRGGVLAAYTLVLLGGIACGQLLINIGSPDGATPFLLAAMFLCIAIVPVGLTTTLAPAPVEKVELHPARLWQRSHAAVIGTVASGLAVGSFWGLAPVFARNMDLDIAEVTLFMTTVIVGGAALQYPLGHLSDRMDRRMMLVALGLVGALASSAIAAWSTTAALWVGAFVYGACALALYPVSLAHAADACERHEFVEVGTAMLLLNAAGSVIGPLVASALMYALAPVALFGFNAAVFALSAMYIAVRLWRREPPLPESREPFVMASETSPSMFDVDPRSDAGSE